MSSPLPPDIKKRIQKIADEKGYEVQDPGTVFKNKDGKVWVFVVDKATDMPLWMLVRCPKQRKPTTVRRWTALLESVGR